MNHIEVKDLYFAYGSEYVIKNLNFNLKAGDLVILTGENGSGKSTLLKLILGELKPTKGKINLLGEDVGKKENFIKVGYVPQVQNFDKIAFPITCKEMVMLNQYTDFGSIKIPQKKHKENAISIMKDMGLEKHIERPFNQLSGGLQQRVVISRAMINSPDLLVLDEPTAGIDKASKRNFLELIRSINQDKGISTLIVTHELELVKSILEPDWIVRLEEGRLINA